MSIQQPTLNVENDTAKTAETRKFPTVIDGATGRVSKPKQRTPLKTLEHVKRELGRLYRSVKAGDLPSDEGSRRAFILNTLGRIIEAADLERRLEILEKQQLLPAPDRPAPDAPPDLTGSSPAQ
jgi:hypothetical protein